MKSTHQARTRWTLGALAFALAASFATAQARDEYGEVQQTVARISFLSGQVSFARGDDPDDWQPADRNVPMTLGDRVYTGSRSRIELELQGGDTVRLGARSDFAALNLTDDTQQFSLRSGVASIQIRRLSDNEIFEIDTPNAAVTFDRAGSYRVDVDENGNTRVSVRRGSATVAAGGGQIPVEAGEGIDIEGLDTPRYDVVSLAGADAWDQWVTQRDSRRTSSRSYQYVNAEIVGADDLDEYGRWENVPSYGWAWSPTTVAADWAPYRSGHWIWQDPWGWTWVSVEPWGWAPYHYGRWANVSSRWYWVPDGPSARSIRYAPALVGFVGGGPGWSATVSIGGGGYVGWFPLGPRDSFSPWWGSRARVGFSSVGSNVAYANRSYVTVVNRNTFVSGGVVNSNIVRDRAVVSQVAAAPVLRGPIPVVPTRGSLHVAVRADAAAAPRPPAALVSRMVVARTAPPPAPPTFQSKLAVITESRGAPVAPDAAARISVENRGRPQAVTEVRAVAPDSGRVTLSPRDANAGAATARRVEPVTAVRGRPMATSEQPVSARPVTGAPAPPAGAPPGREREIGPRQALPPAQAAPQAPPDTARERRVAPAPPEQPSTQPAERARPQTNEDWRRRVPPPTAAPAPAQPAAPPMERRQLRPAPEKPAPPPPNAERGREQPTSPTPPPATIERRREQPAPAPPPQQQPDVQRGRERPPDSPPAREARPEAPRGAPPAPPPPTAAPNQERPQVQRGRPAPPPTTPKPDDKKDQKDKKDERERKPD
jgi:hypothetical protein